MNPYNQQQYPYNYQQHTPGPPQPQWEAPPRRQGWFDPRQQQQQPQPQQQEQHPAQSPGSQYQQQPQGYPLPPPPPSAPSPRPQINQYNTQSWGVKYNHNQAAQSEEYRPQWNQQSEELRPPLPPRPTSSTAQHGPAAQAEPWHTAAGLPSQPATAWQGPFQNQNQHQSQPNTYDIPPPPPPRPPEYQAQIQAQYQSDSIPHQHYSHQAPSHHYEPQVQNPQTPVYPAKQHGMTFASPTSPLSHMAQPSTDPALVSPIDPEPHHWPQQSPFTGSSGPQTSQAPQSENHFYSSALGTGGPSDWEHFNDGQNISPSIASPPPMPAVLSQPATMSSPTQMPAAMSQSPVAPTERPGSIGQLHTGHAQPSHRESETSSVPTQGINRTGTIDSVIQAWNQSLAVSPKPTQQCDSGLGSREQTPMHVPERVPERVVEREKVIEKVVDPYDDLTPEFKASLKRYAATLRKEIAAETDEAKFEIFQSFLKKETRLRSMLYGIEEQYQDSRAEKKPDGHVTQPARDVRPQEQVSVLAASTPSAASHTFELPLLNPTAVAASPSLSQPLPSSDPVQLQQVAQSQPVQPAVENSKKPDGKTAESTSVPEAQNVHGASEKRPASIRPHTPPAFNIPATEGKNVSPRNGSSTVVNGRDGVGDEDDPEYSPGGRPLLNKPQDVAEFSPGGRPRINRPPVITNQPKQPENSTTQSLADGSNRQSSPSADAPMVLEDYKMAQPSSPGANAPMLMEPESGNDLSQAITGGYGSTRKPRDGQSGQSVSDKITNSIPTIRFEPPRPAYLPFKYNPNTVQVPTQSADKSYSSLRKDALDSGRLLAIERVSAPESLVESTSSSPGPSRPQDEAFIGLIRSQSKAVRPKKIATSNLSTLPQLRPGTPRASTPAVESSVARGNNLSTATAALKTLLPESTPDTYGLSQHAKAIALRAKIDEFPDNFSFINETVVAWDRHNREIRKKQDDERNTRQADSEAHIDGLFNDNEIGYADIADLEAGFKLAEAEKKYQEDKQELDSFTKGVYQPVTARLEKELASLDSHYTGGVDLLDLESEAASRCLNSDSGKAEMGFVMTCVLSLFNKLEIRHQKFAEADVERERRRKRLELTVLYTNGDTAGVKKLEQEFALAEKVQVLHKARARDTRANKLMDSFDRATVRGLGDNQTYVDDLLMRLSTLKEVILEDPSNISPDFYAPQGPRDSLSLAQKVVDFVLADSQKLLTVSNVSDKMLNDADYSVSVAEARVSDADESTYQKLAQEKEKEDAKIVEDTNSRMSSIGKAPEEAIALIRDVVDKVGDDAEHQERIKKALEAAKQRNAAGEAGK